MPALTVETSAPIAAIWDFNGAVTVAGTEVGGVAAGASTIINVNQPFEINYDFQIADNSGWNICDLINPALVEWRAEIFFERMGSSESEPLAAHRQRTQAWSGCGPYNLNWQVPANQVQAGIYRVTAVLQLFLTATNDPLSMVAFSDLGLFNFYEGIV